MIPNYPYELLITRMTDTISIPDICEDVSYIIAEYLSLEDLYPIREKYQEIFTRRSKEDLRETLRVACLFQDNVLFDLTVDKLDVTFELEFLKRSYIISHVETLRPQLRKFAIYRIVLQTNIESFEWVRGIIQCTPEILEHALKFDKIRNVYIGDVYLLPNIRISNFEYHLWEDKRAADLSIDKLLEIYNVYPAVDTDPGDGLFQSLFSNKQCEENMDKVFDWLVDKQLFGSGAVWILVEAEYFKNLVILVEKNILPFDILPFDILREGWDLSLTNINSADAIVYRIHNDDNFFDEIVEIRRLARISSNQQL